VLVPHIQMAAEGSFVFGEALIESWTQIALLQEEIQSGTNTKYDDIILSMMDDDLAETESKAKQKNPICTWQSKKVPYEKCKADADMAKHPELQVCSKCLSNVMRRLNREKEKQQKIDTFYRTRAVEREGMDDVKAPPRPSQEKGETDEQLRVAVEIIDVVIYVFMTPEKNPCVPIFDWRSIVFVLIITNF
jgi:murein L,D-transpeptidase YcbB/YkuD